MSKSKCQINVKFLNVKRIYFNLSFGIYNWFVIRHWEFVIYSKDMLLALIIFLLIFSFLIISHELGHFLVAKRLGIKVEEFGIGYAPRIFGRKIGETIYSINWIPFGGFVRIYGENPDEKNVKGPRSLANRPPRQKTAVLLAGVAANFLVAIILSSYYYNTSVTFQGFRSPNIRGLKITEPLILNYWIWICRTLVRSLWSHVALLFPYHYFTSSFYANRNIKTQNIFRMTPKTAYLQWINHVWYG